MKFSAKVEGFDQLDKMLAGFTERMTSGAVNRALKKAAEPIAERARELAPVKTGRLKRAIGTSKRSTVEASGRIRDGEAKIFIGVSGYAATYAEEIEYGTIDSAGQPFMRPAVADKKEEAVRILAKELGEEIANTRRRADKHAAKAAASEQIDDEMPIRRP